MAYLGIDLPLIAAFLDLNSAVICQFKPSCAPSLKASTCLTKNLKQWSCATMNS